MNKKKRVTVVCILLVVLPYLGIHFTNDCIAKGLENQLLDCPLPPGTQIIESTSIAGKMLGNGNGMQWFGIVLVKSDMDEDQLFRWYYPKIVSEGAADIAVIKQETPFIFGYGNKLFESETDFHQCYQIRLSGNVAVGTESSFVEGILNADLRGH